MPNSQKMLYLLLHLMLEEQILTKDEYVFIIKEMEEGGDETEASKRACQNVTGDKDSHI